MKIGLSISLDGYECEAKYLIKMFLTTGGILVARVTAVAALTDVCIVIDRTVLSAINRFKDLAQFFIRPQAYMRVAGHYVFTTSRCPDRCPVPTSLFLSLHTNTKRTSMKFGAVITTTNR